METKKPFDIIFVGDGFKSYYVVWKQSAVPTLTAIGNSLNRTM